MPSINPNSSEISNALLLLLSIQFPPDSNNIVLVAEVSSFQLETINIFKPKIAAILNITPDHLNRYENVDMYADAKIRITENQDERDYLILNYDDERCRDIAEKTKANVYFFSRKTELEKGFFVRNNQIIFSNRKGEKEQYICNVSDMLLVGGHNVENVLAGIAAAFLFGIKKEDIVKGIKNFRGVEHRIELVCEVNGVKYYNDSKSTNTDSLEKALLSFEQPIILIAGGRDKDLNFSSLTSLVKEKVKRLVLIGEAKEKMRAAWGMRWRGSSPIQCKKPLRYLVNVQKKEMLFCSRLRVQALICLIIINIVVMYLKK